MDDTDIKMIKVNRLSKQEKFIEDKLKQKRKKEHLLKIIKVKRVKDEPKTLEAIRNIKVINFKKEYEEFLKLGTSPDAYVEKTTNSIAFIYFYAKEVGMDINIVINRLKEIRFDEFMKIYTEMGVVKLEAMGVYEKMNNGAAILLNLLLMINIENDKNLKLPMSLREFQKAIFTNNYWDNKNRRPAYKIKGLARVFIIKDGVMIPVEKLDDDTVLARMKSLNSPNIMIEYGTGRFVNIPYSYFKRLSRIKKFEMKHFIIIDSIDEGLTHAVPFEDLMDGADGISYYDGYKSVEGLRDIISTIVNYESFSDCLADYNSLTDTGCYTDFEYIVLTMYSGKVLKMTYTDFINKYFQFIKL